MSKKVDCLNKKIKSEREQLEQSWKEIAEWENAGAVELWNSFVEIANALSDFEDMGCDIGRCYAALSKMLRSIQKPVNRQLIEKWLDEGEFEYKGLEDCENGGLIGKALRAIKEQDDAILNPKMPMIDDKDYPAETI